MYSSSVRINELRDRWRTNVVEDCCVVKLAFRFSLLFYLFRF